MAPPLRAVSSGPVDLYAFTNRPADASPTCEAWIRSLAASRDPMFHAVIDQATGEAIGLAAFMRIDCANGVIEVGHLNYGPDLPRTRAGTEAIYLMMHRAFDQLGLPPPGVEM